jgi:hypothetical protein
MIGMRLGSFIPVLTESLGPCSCMPNRTQLFRSNRPYVTHTLMAFGIAPLLTRLGPDRACHPQ